MRIYLLTALFIIISFMAITPQNGIAFAFLYGDDITTSSMDFNLQPFPVADRNAILDWSPEYRYDDNLMDGEYFNLNSNPLNFPDKKGLSYSVNTNFFGGDSFASSAISNAIGTWDNTPSLNGSENELDFFQLDGSYSLRDNPNLLNLNNSANRGANIDFFSRSLNGTAYADSLGFTDISYTFYREGFEGINRDPVTSPFDVYFKTVDIYFNEDYNWVYNGDPALSPNGYFDLESIALHEIGHAIGLGHPHSNATPSAGGDYYLRNYDNDNDPLNIIDTLYSPLFPTDLYDSKALMVQGARPNVAARTLTFDDLGGRDFLYAALPVSEPFIHPVPVFLSGLFIGGFYRIRKRGESSHIN